MNTITQDIQSRRIDTISIHGVSHEFLWLLLLAESFDPAGSFGLECIIHSLERPRWRMVDPAGLWGMISNQISIGLAWFLHQIVEIV